MLEGEGVKLNIPRIIDFLGFTILDRAHAILTHGGRLPRAPRMVVALCQSVDLLGSRVGVVAASQESSGSVGGILTARVVVAGRMLEVRFESWYGYIPSFGLVRPRPGLFPSLRKGEASAEAAVRSEKM